MADQNGRSAEDSAISKDRLEMIFRLLTELCYGIPDDRWPTELRPHRSRLLQLRDGLVVSPAPLEQASPELVQVLTIAANVVRDDLGDDDLYIRAGISPTEHDELIGWLRRESFEE